MQEALQTIIDLSLGSELLCSEIDFINQQRMIHLGSNTLIDPKLNPSDMVNSYMFLKSKNDHILAFVIVGQRSVKFLQKDYSVLEFQALISVYPKMGYGSLLLRGLKKYARNKKKTLVGFCITDLLPFYLKNGFKTFIGHSSRFAFVPDERSFLGETPGGIVYVEGDDGLIDEMAEHPNDLAYIKRFG